jgi:hypothetical protein
VTLWLDPVCPYSWNTARWLCAVAEKTGLVIDWQLMSLAVLNEGRELPPAQQARMRDSLRVGRLMAAIAREHGTAGWTAAYFAFGERYFDRSEPVSADLVAHVLMAVGIGGATAAAVSDASPRSCDWARKGWRHHQPNTLTNPLLPARRRRVFPCALEVDT